MTIIAGDFTYGTNNINVHFQYEDTPEVRIGKFCSIATDINIFVGGGHEWRWGTSFPFGIIGREYFDVPRLDGVSVSRGGVTIGNDVWLGHGVTIMSGVTIGDGAVIAANAHVFKDIPPYEVWGGNPAKLIKKRFDERFINEFLKMQWWNYSNEVILELIPHLQQPPNDDTIAAMWNIINKI